MQGSMGTTGQPPHALSERGGNMSAAPGRSQASEGPLGGQPPHEVGGRGGKVLIVDDHWAIRQALTDVVSHCPGLTLVGQALDGQQALDMTLLYQPDVLVLDIALPRVRGLQVLRELRLRASPVKVLIFTMHPASSYASMARSWGAQGFLSKDADETSICAAILALVNGQTYFPTLARADEAQGELDAMHPLDKLSRRENEVFRGLIRGEPNKDIAARLGISPKSVTTYRDRLFTKLNVDSIAQLCTMAAREEVL